MTGSSTTGTFQLTMQEFDPTAGLNIAIQFLFCSLFEYSSCSVLYLNIVLGLFFI